MDYSEFQICIFEEIYCLNANLLYMLNNFMNNN